MRNAILPQVAKAGGLDGVEFAYVDFDRQPQLAAQLSQSKSIPQLIRLQKTRLGWDSRVLVGAKAPREVHAFVNTGLASAAGQRDAAYTANSVRFD
jgi:hypothetical protein